MEDFFGKKGDIVQDQAVAFRRPRLFPLTALHEKQPEQGLFYREDGRPFLRLWMKNACDLELFAGKRKFIFLEVERNVWEVSLPLSPGFYYVTLAVNGVEVLSPFLPIGYGNSRPCNYLDIAPVREEYTRRRVPHGDVRYEYFFSETTGREECCLVYVPPKAFLAGERLPVLYLQHGFGENETSWVWQGRIANLMDNLLAQKKAERMLVVMADGMLRSPGNEKELAHGLFPDFFKKDLMPFIESKYAVRTDREGRAIAGLSMGSMQAAMTAFPNPGLFAWIGLFSGFLRNYIGVEEVEDAHLRGVLDDPQAFHEGCRLLFRAMGREDVFFSYFMEEDEICESSGLKQVRRVYEGGHDWNVWRQCALEFLPMLFRE